MFLRIALEHAGTDQVGGVAHRMHERLGVVDDESPRGDSLLQPRHEMLVLDLPWITINRPPPDTDPSLTPPCISDIRFHPAPRLMTRTGGLLFRLLPRLPRE